MLEFKVNEISNRKMYILISISLRKSNNFILIIMKYDKFTITRLHKKSKKRYKKIQKIVLYIKIF